MMKSRKFYILAKNWKYSSTELTLIEYEYGSNLYNKLIQGDPLSFDDIKNYDLIDFRLKSNHIVVIPYVGYSETI